MSQFIWITEYTYLRYILDSLVAQAVKSQPAMQGTWVQSLGWEDSPGEGNGNPLEYSCLENPMDGEAWQATVHQVAKSQTRLSDFTFILSFLLRYFLILKTKKNSSIMIVIRILVTFVGRALYGLERAKRDPSWVNRMFYKFIWVQCVCVNSLRHRLKLHPLYFM